MKTYNPKESAEYLQNKPTSFNKSYEAAKKVLKNRIKTFESHGKGQTASAKRLKQSLYDIQTAKSKSARSKAFSEATQSLNSARGSYTRSESVNAKIARELNSFLQIRKHNDLKITLSEMDEFGDIMEYIKDHSLENIFGSSQVVVNVREIQQKSKKEKIDWHILVDQWINKVEENYKP